MIRNIQGQTLHNNLCCTLIKYHTDRKLHSTGNVQGQTHIKINFNFVQGHSDRQSDIVDYRAAYFAAKKWVFFKASLIVIEISWILTLIMKTSLYRNTQLYMKATFIDLSDLVQ